MDPLQERSVKVSKGSWIEASWVYTRFVSIAGLQMKGEGTFVRVTGIVRHLRGSHPDATEGQLLIDTEMADHVSALDFVDCEKCRRPHVLVESKHVVDVAPPRGEDAA